MVSWRGIYTSAGLALLILSSCAPSVGAPPVSGNTGSGNRDPICLGLPGLTCPAQLTGSPGQGGCQVSMSCPMPDVTWTDACHPNSAQTFVEKIDWGDGTKETITGASQGCVQGTCQSSSLPTSQYATTYLLHSGHLYSSTGTFTVAMTIDDSALGETKPCTVFFTVNVS